MVYDVCMFCIGGVCLRAWRMEGSVLKAAFGREATGLQKEGGGLLVCISFPCAVVAWVCPGSNCQSTQKQTMPPVRPTNTIIPFSLHPPFHIPSLDHKPLSISPYSTTRLVLLLDQEGVEIQPFESVGYAQHGV